MKKTIPFLLFAVLFFACHQSNKTSIIFLDEHVIQDSLQFKNSILGGFSGIDYANNYFYLVVDDAEKPRYVKANIVIQSDKIKNIKFNDIVFLKDSTSNFYHENALDLESIFVDEKEVVFLVSEGSIRKNKLPSVFKINKKGEFLDSYQLPKHLTSLKNIKHNAAFEASSKSVNHNGFWVAMEGVLHADGEEPTFQKTASPIRITYFDKKTKKATKQFAYQLEHITKPAKGNINLNGVTALLEYKENHFLIVERIYQSGYGAYGNIVQIFEAVIDDESTNVLEIDSLKNTSFIPLKKRLVFSFEDIRSQLNDGIVDNIEGITFGPKLSNGNQSLVLVADDNFQIYGKQINQFILLEIENK